MDGLIGLLVLEIILIPFATIWTQVMVSRRWDNLLRKLPWEEFCLTRIKPDEFMDWIIEPVRLNVRAGARFLFFSTPLCAIIASFFRSSLEEVCCGLVGIVLLLLYRHALLLCSANYNAAIAFRSILYALESTTGLLRSAREALVLLIGFFLALLGTFILILLSLSLWVFVEGPGRNDHRAIIAFFAFMCSLIVYLLPFACVILLPVYMAIRSDRIRNNLSLFTPLWRGAEGREDGYAPERVLSFPLYLIGRLGSTDLPRSFR